MPLPLARPGQSLSEHTENVVNGIENIFSLQPPEYPRLVESVGEEESRRILLSLFRLVGNCHDFGKLSPFFQMKVRGARISRSEMHLSYHIQTGALLAALAAKKIVDGIPDSVASSLVAIVTASILEHHSPHLRNIIEPRDGTAMSVSLANSLFSETKTTIQVLQLMKQACQEETSLEGILPSGALIDCARELLEFEEEEILNLIDYIDSCFLTLSRAEESSNYLLYRLLYSSLCDMDELDARLSKRNEEISSWISAQPQTSTPEDIIDQYRKEAIESGKWPAPSNSREERIQFLRNETYEKTVQCASSHDGLLTLEAPTGSGKTLAMLSFAYRKRFLISKQEGYTPRIIYALPFISIAEQVENELREILDLRDEGSSHILTVHHSLSEPKWFDKEGNEYEPEYAPLRIDLWASEIVVTTMVRLWETILGSSKRDAIRFNRISGSIIIMDEVQSIPVRYWALVSEMLQALVSDLGCTVLLGTATMPAIIEHANHSSVEVEAEGINRYILDFDPVQVSLTDWIEEIQKTLVNRPSSNILVVMNTKRSAFLVYDALQASLSERDDIFFLSGLVAPVHRSKTIERVSTLLEDSFKRVVLVSTQVIEAGVDVSFDAVFRDFAPIDSIVQVAGRSNRSWEEKEPGTIMVRTVIDDENQRAYASYVYDRIDLEMVMEAFNGAPSILTENELSKRCKRYMRDVKTRKRTKTALGCALRLEMEELDHQFNLITKYEGVRQVFVDCDSLSSAILEEIRTSSRGKNLRLPAKFWQYAVDVSRHHYESLGEELEDFEAPGGAILFSILDAKDSDYYSHEFGLTPPE